MAEGTVVGQITEADFFGKLKGLGETPFLLRDTATRLYCNPKMAEHFKSNFFEEDGTFRLDKFLHHLEKDLDTQLKRLRGSSHKVEWDCGFFFECSKCVKKATHSQQPLMHCEHKSPLITNTKVGPCIVLSVRSRTVTIDFVLLFPTIAASCTTYIDEYSSLSFQHQVIDTLTGQKGSAPPINWLSHLKKFLKQDRLLSENFFDTDLHNLDSDWPPYLSLKLLNFNQSDYYIIRPGHVHLK